MKKVWELQSFEAPSSRVVSLVPEKNIDPHQMVSDSEEEDEEPQVNNSLVIPDNKKRKEKWGLVIPTRMSSRIINDGRTIGEKAQALKKTNNLEIPKVKPNHGINNSFAVLGNDTLMHKAALL
jgi:hypothetical protein